MVANGATIIFFFLLSNWSVTRSMPDQNNQICKILNSNNFPSDRFRLNFVWIRSNWVDWPGWKMSDCFAIIVMTEIRVLLGNVSVMCEYHMLLVCGECRGCRCTKSSVTLGCTESTAGVWEEYVRTCSWWGFPRVSAVCHQSLIIPYITKPSSQLYGP